MDGLDEGGGREVRNRFPNLAIGEAHGALWVTIDRPGDRNSLDSETIEQLQAQLDDAVRTVLVYFIFNQPQGSRSSPHIPL